MVTGCSTSLLLHHCVASDHQYESFRLLMDIERTRTVTSRAVKYPALHIAAADCERGDVPARLLTGVATLATLRRVLQFRGQHSFALRLTAVHQSVCIHYQNFLIHTLLYFFSTS